MPDIFDQIVPQTYEGRQVVNNPDGSWSHEKSISIEADGKFMNIPTLFGGKEYKPNEAVDIMRKNNWVDPDTGKPVPTFKSQQEAVSAAQAKEAAQQNIGQPQGGDIFDQVAPQKTIGQSVRAGLENIFPSIVNTAKEIGQAAVTPPKEGFLTPVSPMTSIQRLIDLAKGAASGATAGIYKPEAPTDEAAAARQLLGQVGGTALPFTAAAKGAQAAGVGSKLLADIIAGAATGATEPISRGDIPGAVQQGITGAGAVGVVEPVSQIPSKLIRGTGKTIESIMNQREAKSLGGASNILQTATENLAGPGSVETAGQALQAGEKSAAKTTRAAAGSLIEQGLNAVPDNEVITSSASNEIRDLLSPGNGPLTRTAAKRLEKLATDLEPAVGTLDTMKVGGVPLSMANPSFRDKVLQALGAEQAAKTAPEAQPATFTRAAEPVTPQTPVEAIIQAAKTAPTAAEPPITRLFPQPPQENAPPPRVIPKIVMGETGYRDSPGNESGIPNQPPPRPPAVGESIQTPEGKSYLNAYAGATEPIPAGRSLPPANTVETRAARLEEPLPTDALMQGREVTLKELEGRRQSLNQLLRDTTNDADRRLYRLAMNAVNKDIDQFAALHPDAIATYRQGLQQYREQVAPYYTKGAPLRDLVDETNPSKTINRLQGMDLEEIRTIKKGLLQGPDGKQALNDTQSGVIRNIIENSTDKTTRSFDARKFVENTGSPEVSRNLAELLGDRYADLEGFRQQLIDAGAESFKTHGGSRQMGYMGAYHLLRGGEQLAIGSPFAFYHLGTAATMFIAPKLFMRIMENRVGANLLAQGAMVTEGSAQAAAIASRLSSLARALGGQEIATGAGVAAAAGNAGQKQKKKTIDNLFPQAPNP